MEKNEPASHFEPEIDDVTAEKSATKTLIRIIAGIGGVSLATAGVIFARKYSEAIQEAIELRRRK